MINDFLLVCKACMQKYKTWEASCQCNIHNENGLLVLTCFNCGTEEVFTPFQRKKTTKKQFNLIKERETIKGKLN